MQSLAIPSQGNSLQNQALSYYERKEVNFKASYSEISYQASPGSSGDKSVKSLNDSYQPGNYKAVSFETSMTVIEERAYASIGNSVDIPEKLQSKYPSLSGDYYTPENTAERIVDFATGFLDVFKGIEENKNLDDKEVLNKFEKLIRGAIEQGFKEARDILKSFSGGELSRETNQTIDDTFNLVQEKLDQYFSAQRQSLEEMINKPEENKTENEKQE